MPDSSEYLAKIRSNAEGKDPLEVQRESPRVLAELISGVPDEKLRQRPHADKWSVAEILAHLADDEISSAWRYRQMVEHDGLQLSGFDQDLWAEIGDYRSADPHDSLSLFRLLRESNLRLLARLTPKQWQCSGMHVERGKITVQELARHMAGHDLNHIGQIRKILSK